MDEFDVISIGDVVTDAFIKLIDENAHTYSNEEGKWLAMPFGSKVPFDHAEVIAGVGNAPNASVSFARLGLKSALVANVGGDPAGIEIIHALHKNKVDTRFIRVNPGKLSNYHYVLWYKEERTILIKHEVYDYHWPHIIPKELPKWIYFSSVSKDTMEYHDQIADWLAVHPDVKLAFQPGTFQMEAGVERLKRLYRRTEVLLLNREEAALVSGGDHNNVHDLLDKLHALGPKTVIITDGPKGAFASDGTKRLKMPPYPDPKPPFERTGAGDSFSSALVAALIKGKDIEVALQWGPINSMSVVQYTGAQAGLLDQKSLEELLSKAPEWYKAEPF
jgi:sugar/nucleoside kinase (ribokinase family)